MNKIRMRFSKSGALAYIGHLDFMKLFQQTIRRAGLPVAYSQGFNPHILLSFALPLPLGMTSHNDYADLTLETPLPAEEIINPFNAKAPAGLMLTGAWPYEGAGAAAITTAADYYLSTSTPLTAEINQILSQSEIIIPKKTKSGVKDTDIRPDILDVWELPVTHGTSPSIAMRLAAGSARFLNPVIVANLLTKQEVPPSSIIRAELYSKAQSGTREAVSLYEAPVH